MVPEIGCRSILRINGSTIYGSGYLDHAEADLACILKGISAPVEAFPLEGLA
jgi:hypothetical protein